MILISHRGNIKGREIEKENDPLHIENALAEGYEVEIDVWLIDNEIFLGHDDPDYKVEKKFLYNKLWCHAKNTEALQFMLEDKQINCFWHQKDDYTITKNGFIWVYPSKKLVKDSIAVLPEATNYSLAELKECFAICSDNIEKYKEIL